MISGRNSETTYEQTENLKPGKTSSVTAAPPTRWRFSSTTTRRPARARYAALVRPLWPAPITITSYDDGMNSTLYVVGQTFRSADRASSDQFARPVDAPATTTRRAQ